APYGSYSLNKKEWEPSEALLQTNQLITAKAYTAYEFVNLVDQVYADVQEFSALAEDNAKKLKEHVVTNWLILPRQKTELEDNDTNFWRSRSIAAQTTIFTKYPDEPFNSWLDFQSYKIEHGVDCSNYLINKGLQNGVIFSSKIQIGDLEEPIFC